MLPLARPEAGVTPERTAGALQDVRVLVVEDGEDTRELIVRLLSDAGAVVSEAENAQQAIESVDRDPPHVLVSDIGMARTDGYMLLRMLRDGGWPASRLPAIALTAFVRGQDQAESLEAGFQVHLGKPVNANALIGAVARLNAGRSA